MTAAGRPTTWPYYVMLEPGNDHGVWRASGKGSRFIVGELTIAQAQAVAHELHRLYTICADLMRQKKA